VEAKSFHKSLKEAFHMQDLNQTTLGGRATAAPTMIARNKGVTFSLASNRSYRKEDSDQWIEVVTYLDCVAWNGLALMIGRKLRKGDACVVVGRLETQKWADATTGEPRSKTVLTVTGISGEFGYRKLDDAPEPTLLDALNEATTQEAPAPPKPRRRKAATNTR
jgi:single stranded DNA-binding protein